MQQTVIQREERRTDLRTGKQAAVRLRLNETAELENLFSPYAECAQLSLEPFSAEATILSADALRIITHRTPTSIRFVRHRAVGTISIMYVAHGKAVMHRGRPIGAGDLLLVNDADAQLNVTGPAEITWIDVQLEQLPRLQADALASALPAHQSILTCGETRAASLGHLVCALLMYHLNGLGEQRVCYAARELIESIRRALSSAHPKPLSSKRERAFALVERVESFMWENVEDTLTLERICKAASCRARNLTYSFKAIAGVGPMTYLKIRRLEEAHRRLRALRSDFRIFDIAADFGFWHMGHFGADYKRMFGATPSATRMSG